MDMTLHPPGARIAGRYLVASRPLLGGMGIVYLCEDLEEKRPVALKTFRPEYLPDRAARDRFLREGTTWVDLGAHPHVVRCYRVVRVGDGTEVYLALELVAKEEGRADASLRAWLTLGQPLPVETALLFALQAARGMSHAVATIPGFVHRDLKPENLLVGVDRVPDGSANRLRITDFGLARALGAAEALAAPGEEERLLDRPGLTRVGAVLGTPPYMAPEQWERADVDLRADIYALGCMMGEMLRGRMLVREKTLHDFRQAHQGGRAAAWTTDLTGSLAGLLSRCLAVDPAARYGSWAEVEAALAAAYRAVTGRPAPAPKPAAARGRAERVAAGWSYSEMGMSYLDLGKPEVALQYFQRVRVVGEAERERSLIAAALGNLGVAYTDLGDARRAFGYYEQAMATAREIGDRRGERNALSGLGIAYSQLGDARRAIGYHEQAIAIGCELGDRRGEGKALGNLGLTYRALGDARRAIGYYEQQLVITREVGDRRGERNALGSLGNAYADLGDARRAIGYHKQALTIARELGDRRGEGNALGSLGVVYRNLGNARQAIGYFEQQLVITREIGDRRGEGNALGNLGTAYGILGEARQAVGYLEQELVITREIGDRRGEGIALANLGIAYKNLGEAQRAIGYYEQAMAIAREIGDRRGEALGSWNLGSLYRQQGDLKRAAELMKVCVNFEREIGHPDAEKDAALVAQLQGGGPSPAQILADCGPLIEAVVAGARGNRPARAQAEVAFGQLTQAGWRIADLIQRLWAGERDEARLTAGLDESDTLIVREILKRLKD